MLARFVCIVDTLDECAKTEHSCDSIKLISKIPPTNQSMQLHLNKEISAI